MTPFYDHGGVTLYRGDVLDVLRDLPGESVQCVVTSPPYWGLRDYGTAKWIGGDLDCSHRSPTMREGRNEDRPKLAGSESTNQAQLLLAARSACGKCGAVRIDSQLGLESTPSCGLHGFMRLRADLTESETAYVVQRLLGAGARDVQECGKDDDKE